MKLTKADRERVRGAIVGLQLRHSLGLSYHLPAADALLARLEAGTLEDAERRTLCSAFVMRAHTAIGHIRRGREYALSFLQPEEGTYYATRPHAERQEMASRQVRDEGKHVREAHAFVRLEKAVREMRVEKGAVA
jgi:hypothetical protein